MPSILEDRSWLTHTAERGWIFTHTVTYKSVFYPEFIPNMKRFSFIVYVVLTVYCYTADRFQKWAGECHQQGPGRCSVDLNGLCKIKNLHLQRAEILKISHSNRSCTHRVNKG